MLLLASLRGCICRRSHPGCGVVMRESGRHAAGKAPIPVAQLLTSASAEKARPASTRAGGPVRGTDPTRFQGADDEATIIIPATGRVHEPEPRT
jgi:hypothetical protein